MSITESIFPEYVANDIINTYDALRSKRDTLLFKSNDLSFPEAYERARQRGTCGFRKMGTTFTCSRQDDFPFYGVFKDNDVFSRHVLAQSANEASLLRMTLGYECLFGKTSCKFMPTIVEQKITGENVEVYSFRINLEGSFIDKPIAELSSGLRNMLPENISFDTLEERQSFPEAIDELVVAKGNFSSLSTHSFLPCELELRKMMDVGKTINTRQILVSTPNICWKKEDLASHIALLQDIAVSYCSVASSLL